MKVFFFVLFLLVTVVNAPGLHVDLPEADEDRLDEIIRALKTMASNVKPPLPTPLMAATILFVFCTTVPARLAASWGFLVHWAASVVNQPAAPAPQGPWALRLSRLVVSVDGMLSPFKLDGLQKRAADANAKLKDANARLAKFQACFEM